MEPASESILALKPVTRFSLPGWTTLLHAAIRFDCEEVRRSEPGPG